jgi:hypothetical protein
MILNVVTPSACTFSLGKLGGRVLFQWRNGGHDYHSFLLLIAIRDLVELEKVFFCKAHKILTPSSLLACQQLEQSGHNTA